MHVIVQFVSRYKRFICNDRDCSRSRIFVENEENLNKIGEMDEVLIVAWKWNDIKKATETIFK